MEFTAKELQEKIKKEYALDCSVFPLSETLTFYGTELECYRMAYKFKNKTNNHVAYSKNLQTWYISFYNWFSIEMAQQITS